MAARVPIRRPARSAASPSGPRRARARGGGRGAGWATEAGAQARAVCGYWVLGGRGGLRSATHPPPTPRPAPPPVDVMSGSRGTGGRGPRAHRPRAGPGTGSLPAPPPSGFACASALSSPVFTSSSRNSNLERRGPPARNVQLSGLGHRLTTPKSTSLCPAMPLIPPEEEVSWWST